MFLFLDFLDHSVLVGDQWFCLPRNFVLLFFFLILKKISGHHHHQHRLLSLFWIKENNNNNNHQIKANKKNWIFSISIANMNWKEKNFFFFIHSIIISVSVDDYLVKSEKKIFSNWFFFLISTLKISSFLFFTWLNSGYFQFSWAWFSSLFNSQNWNLCVCFFSFWSFEFFCEWKQCFSNLSISVCECSLCMCVFCVWEIYSGTDFHHQKHWISVWIISICVSISMIELAS